MLMQFARVIEFCDLQQLISIRRASGARDRTICRIRPDLMEGVRKRRHLDDRHTGRAGITHYPVRGKSRTLAKRSSTPFFSAA